MPTPTYTSLANVTLGTTAASVTFSSIPATYRDLILVYDWTSTSAASFYIRLNGDSGSNYTRVYMGAISAAASGTESGTGWNGLSLSAGNERQIGTLQIMDYSATDKHKTALNRANQASPYVIADAYRWANTAAVTSASFTMASGTFSAGSTFNLYGVIA